MKKKSETTDLGHKPLVHPFISLTQQADASPCILRVDKINKVTETKKGTKVAYDDRTYLVRESKFDILCRIEDTEDD